MNRLIQTATPVFFCVSFVACLFVFNNAIFHYVQNDSIIYNSLPEYNSAQFTPFQRCSASGYLWRSVFSSFRRHQINPPHGPGGLDEGFYILTRVRDPSQGEHKLGDKTTNVHIDSCLNVKPVVSRFHFKQFQFHLDVYPCC